MELRDDTVLYASATVPYRHNGTTVLLDPAGPNWLANGRSGYSAPVVYTGMGEGSAHCAAGELAPGDVATSHSECVVSFDLDVVPTGTPVTILGKNDGRLGRDGPGVSLGKKVRDHAVHALELSFRLEGADAHFTATLDGTTGCTWSGPVASLGVNAYWSVVHGVITLGTNGTSWEVSELKLRRL